MAPARRRPPERARPPMSVRPARSASLLVAAACAAVVPARAQDLGPGPHAYVLDIATATEKGPYAPWGLGDLARLRLMAAPTVGPLQLDAAWEQSLSWSQQPGGATGPFGSAVAGVGGDWLDLDGTFASDLHFTWRHRVDRLALAATTGRFEARAGRQAISWGTTLFLTPADPFVPFDPADPFREYRTGVDALRLQAFPGPFSALDVVVRPARTAAGRTLTALARAKTTVSRWDLSVWGGMLHDRAAGAAAVTRTVAGAALRAEASLRGEPRGGATLRFAAGADRRWTVAGRDLYVVVEYQHDGFGAARVADLAAVAASAPYLRGEMQVLGRDVAAGQATWQVDPLARAELLLLSDLRDGSLLVAPAVAVSVSNDVAMRGGILLGAGAGPGALELPGSEFGGVPRSAYLSISAYF